MTVSSTGLTRHERSRQSQMVRVSLIDTRLTYFRVLVTALLIPMLTIHYSLPSGLRWGLCDGVRKSKPPWPEIQSTAIPSMFQVHTTQTYEALRLKTLSELRVWLAYSVTTLKSNNTLPAMFRLSVSSRLLASEDQTAVNTINSKQQLRRREQKVFTLRNGMQFQSGLGKLQKIHTRSDC
jgi:hypothetical protein